MKTGSPKPITESKVRQHPRFSGNCGQCKFWSEHQQIAMLLTPEGQMVPAEQLRAQARAMLVQGQPMDLSGMVEFSSAPCVRFPQWQMLPAEHFCAEFKPVKEH